MNIRVKKIKNKFRRRLMLRTSIAISLFSAMATSMLGYDVWSLGCVLLGIICSIYYKVSENKSKSIFK